MGPAKLEVAIPTLIGSLSSMIACACVLLCYAVLPWQSHLRHVLIINLAIADFLNSLNNTISGLYIVSTPSHSIHPGSACEFNAWAGQITVQAVDFSVLAISLCLLWTVTRKSGQMVYETYKKILICLSIWIIPACTSTIGLLLRVYGPVSGNWCWIQPDHVVEQYALGHSWRIIIIIATLIIYAIVSLKLKRLFKPFDYVPDSGRNENLQSQQYYEISSPISSVSPPTNLRPDVITKTVTIEFETNAPKKEFRDAKTHSVAGPFPRPPNPMMSDFATRRRRKVDHMLLLHGYPIFYVLLWLPGLANRLVSVFTTPPLWLTALQSSTQFVGLANALTYGYNENIQRQVKRWYDKRRGKAGGSV